jgi:guanine deaminase
MILFGRLIIDPASPAELGWIEIERDRIARLELGDSPPAPHLGSRDCLITPGFIDAHIHLPQIDSIGCDGLTLLDWLDRVIFPAEAKWSDPHFAERAAHRAYHRMLRAGTLGCAGYLTSHFESVPAAVRAAHRVPLRAIVGQSLMDRNAPDNLLGQTEARLTRSARGRLVSSLNPRFAVSCSDELLAHIGHRLRTGFPRSPKQREDDDPTANLFIQTHLAETREECDLIRTLFPDDPHYAGVYDRFGLLTPHTLLAHCLHLSRDEWELIAARRSVVVHCPTANVFLRSGLFDLDAAREHGVRLALGSDVAAGSDFAMPRVARAMIDTAKMRSMTIAPRAHIPTPAEAWNLITRGNAEALGWPDAGRLEPGAAADLLLLRPPFDHDERLIGRLIHDWSDDWIIERIVNGQPRSLRHEEPIGRTT